MKITMTSYSPKSRYLAVLATFTAALLSVAAVSSTVTTKLTRIQCDPSSNKAQGFFEATTLVDGVTYTAPWTSVSWDINSTKIVTVAGKDYTYAEVSAAVFAIAEQENATPPAPAPVAK